MKTKEQRAQKIRDLFWDESLSLREAEARAWMVRTHARSKVELRHLYNLIIAQYRARAERDGARER